MANLTDWHNLDTEFTHITTDLINDIIHDIVLLFHAVKSSSIAALPSFGSSIEKNLPVIELLPMFNWIEDCVDILELQAAVWSGINDIGWESLYGQENCWNADGTTTLYNTDKGTAITRIINIVDDLYLTYRLRRGRFCNFRLEDQLFASPDRDLNGTHIYVRRTANDTLCVRFFNPNLKKEFVTLEWYYNTQNASYRMYTNNYNESTHGFFWYGENFGAGNELDYGISDWYFDTNDGALDFKLDLNSIRNIENENGFFLPIVNLYQGHYWTPLFSTRVDRQYTLS